MFKKMAGEEIKNYELEGMRLLESVSSEKFCTKLVNVYSKAYLFYDNDTDNCVYICGKAFYPIDFNTGIEPIDGWKIWTGTLTKLQEICLSSHCDSEFEPMRWFIKG